MNVSVLWGNILHSHLATGWGRWKASREWTGTFLPPLPTDEWACQLRMRLAPRFSLMRCLLLKASAHLTAAKVSITAWCEQECLEFRPLRPGGHTPPAAQGGGGRPPADSSLRGSVPIKNKSKNLKPVFFPKTWSFWKFIQLWKVLFFFLPPLGHFCKNICISVSFCCNTIDVCAF